MRFVLVTPERQLLDTEVEEVYAPGVNGQFGVLPKHTTFLTALATGELRYREHGADHYVAVSGGVAEVLGDTLTILADSAEPAGEIDVDRAQAAQRRAAAALGHAATESAESFDLQSALSRALNRIAVAGRAR
jgi:F-type H+-transporting ATPase subunit epsilon